MSHLVNGTKKFLAISGSLSHSFSGRLFVSGWDSLPPETGVRKRNMPNREKLPESKRRSWGNSRANLEVMGSWYRRVRPNFKSENGNVLKRRSGRKNPQAGKIKSDGKKEYQIKEL